MIHLEILIQLYAFHYHHQCRITLKIRLFFKVYCRTQLKYLRFYLFFDHSKMWKLIKVTCYFFQSKFHIAGYGTMTVIYSSVF